MIMKMFVGVNVREGRNLRREIGRRQKGRFKMERPEIVGQEEETRQCKKGAAN